MEDFTLVLPLTFLLLQGIECEPQTIPRLPNIPWSRTHQILNTTPSHLELESLIVERVQFSLTNISRLALRLRCSARWEISKNVIYRHKDIHSTIEYMYTYVYRQLGMGKAKKAKTWHTCIQTLHHYTYISSAWQNTHIQIYTPPLYIYHAYHDYLGRAFWSSECISSKLGRWSFHFLKAFFITNGFGPDDDDDGDDDDDEAEDDDDDYLDDDD